MRSRVSSASTASVRTRRSSRNATGSVRSRSLGVDRHRRHRVERGGRHTCPSRALDANARRIPSAGGIERRRRRVPRRNRSNTEAVTCSTWRACSKPNASARHRRESWLVREAHRRRDQGCCSARSRSEPRPVSRWSALRTRGRNSSAPSTERRSASRRMPASSSGRPIAGADPSERVDVAEPTAALLELGFEEVRHRAVPFTPGVAIGNQALRECAWIAADMRQHRRAHLVPPARIPRGAAVEHRRRPHRAVRLRSRRRPPCRPDGMTDPQAGVPQWVQEALGEQRGLVRRPLVQDQAGRVGTGRELPRPYPPSATSATSCGIPAAAERARGGRRRRARRGGGPTSGRGAPAEYAPSSARSSSSSRATGAGRSLTLEGVGAHLARADPEDLLGRDHPDLAVADLAGASGLR